MDQIERITYYESMLNEVSAALKEFNRAAEAFIGIQGKLSELELYYTSRQWKEDFEASEKGLLPGNLPCGVLSEDGIDHVLDDNEQLLDMCGKMEEIITGSKKTEVGS